MRFLKCSALPSGTIEPPPRLGLVEREYVSGVGKLGDRLIILLDADRLMNGAQEGMFAASETALLGCQWFEQADRRLTKHEERND